MSYTSRAEESLEQKAIQKNKDISEWFDETAEDLDVYLIGKKVTRRINETNLKIENTTYVIQDQSTQNVTGINFNLRLPNVEDYWQLKFSSYDENERRRGAQRGPLRTTPPEQNYGASVALFKKLGKVRTSFQPRINLSNPLKVSQSLAFESNADFPKYQINPKVEFFAEPDKGAGIFNALNFKFPLNKIFTFSFLNNGEYLDKKHSYTVANGLSLGQTLTEKTSLAYSLFFTSGNRDEYHLEDYTFSVAWSHVLYKRILDYQIIPHLAFARINSFKGVPGIVFNVALTF